MSLNCQKLLQKITACRIIDAENKMIAIIYGLSFFPIPKMLGIVANFPQRHGRENVYNSTIV